MKLMNLFLIKETGFFDRARTGSQPVMALRPPFQDRPDMHRLLSFLCERLEQVHFHISDTGEQWKVVEYG